MQFRSSHIFREGNRVADTLANHGIHSSGLIWWDLPLDYILSFCNHDWLGLPNFRFC
jgi:hypothetical protein